MAGFLVATGGPDLLPEGALRGAGRAPPPIGREGPLGVFVTCLTAAGGFAAGFLVSCDFGWVGLEKGGFD